VLIYFLGLEFYFYVKCLFCHSAVLQNQKSLGDPITLPGRGIAHSQCAEKDLISQRVFASIPLKSLADSDLYELKEFVLTEINEREGLNSNEIELF